MAADNLEPKQPPKIKLENLDLGTFAPLGKIQNGEKAKTETTRIDLSSAQPITPEVVEAARQHELKKKTTRIETAAEMAPMAEEDKIEAAKKSTVRVQIDEEKIKGDTARIDRLLGSEAAKKRTARINLNEVLEGEEDIFKRRTALLDASKFAGVTEAPGAPRTIRIKKPDTTSMRPPTQEMAPGELPVAAGEGEAKKSETARIDLPPEASGGDQLPTRRKTIRIKRPGGSITSKALVIGRAPGEGAGVLVRSKEEEDEVGTAFSVLAILALLLTIAVLSVQGMALNSFGQF